MRLVNREAAGGGSRGFNHAPQPTVSMFAFTSRISTKFLASPSGFWDSWLALIWNKSVLQGTSRATLAGVGGQGSTRSDIADVLIPI